MQTATIEQLELDPEWACHYTLLGQLPDGRVCGVLRLMFHWTMHVDLDDTGYRERYCFQTEDMANNALRQWDGSGDPDFWHKHVPSERRRNHETGEIREDTDYRPPSGSR